MVPRRRRRLRRGAEGGHEMMTCVAVCILGLAVLCAGASDAAAQFKAASVSLYIPSGIGGGYDAYGRLAARHLGRFLPGNPAILADAKNMRADIVTEIGRASCR